MRTYDIVMKFRFSISLKLLLFILPLICLPIALVGYFSFNASVEGVDRLVRHEQMVQVRATAGELNDIFYYCRLDLETIAGLPVLEDYHNARSFRLNAEAEFNHDNIVRLFRDFIGRTVYYYQIRYLDHQGAELIRVRREGLVKKMSRESVGTYFSQARDVGKAGIFVSGIVNSADRHGYLIRWAKPIFSGLREFAGVVIIDLDYEQIRRKVNQIHVGDQGYAFLVDQTGRSIAHPRFPPFRYDLDSYPNDSLKQMVREMMTGASGWKQYHFEGQQKVAAFSSIPIMKWSLAVTIPAKEFRKEALTIRTRVVQVVAITLIFAVAGVTILSYFLLKPVRTLAAATNRIAAGDLTHEIPIQSRDELADLTRSFNHMVKNLARIQNELVRSEKLISLGRLSAGVAHEIRNPLNAMKGAMVHLQRRRTSDPLICEYTGLVSEEIDRLNQFVTEFLYFARQSVPRTEPADLNKLILSTQTLFRRQAEKKDIRFYNRLDPELPIMEVDPNQLEQVLVNVLINAMDAISGGGDITFSSRHIKHRHSSDSGDQVQVTVKDNGSGISDVHLQNIFDPFFSTKEDGTGLGLPLSLGIVENHGGTLEISSRSGRGTAVIILLPVDVGLLQRNNHVPDEKNSGSRRPGEQS